MSFPGLRQLVVFWHEFTFPEKLRFREVLALLLSLCLSQALCFACETFLKRCALMHNILIYILYIYIYMLANQSSEPFESTTVWRGGHLIRCFFLRKLRMRVISCQGGNRVPSSLEWCLGFWCPFVLKLTSQVSMISPSSKSCINPLIWQSICIVN